jgi:hypothetical protein
MWVVTLLVKKPQLHYGANKCSPEPRDFVSAIARCSHNIPCNNLHPREMDRAYCVLRLMAVTNSPVEPGMLDFI